MRKASTFSWLSLILMVISISFLPLSSNAQLGNWCFFEPDSNNTPQNATNATSTAVCNSNNVYSNPDRYKYQENFIPDPNDPVKTIRLRLVVLQNSNVVGNKGNFEENSQDTAFIHSIFDYINQTLLPDLRTPEVPQTCVCGNDCYIQDSRIRIDLEEIDYILDDQGLYGKDKDETNKNTYLNAYGENSDELLNIFWLGDSIVDNTGGYPTGAWVSEIPDYTDLEERHVIYAKNYNQAYETALANQSSNPNSVAWTTKVLANNMFHEIGHIFGLRHLYEHSEYPIGYVDYLDDYFGAGTTNCPSIPSPWHDFCCYGPDSSCSLNIMGAHCTGDQREATPKQLGRIHRNMMLSSSRMYVRVDTTLHPDHLITSDETWEFSIRMYSNIVVKSGATLTLKCEVFMPPAGNIYVEPGAELIVDGGTITSYRDNYLWGGIQVAGDNTKSQLEYNGVQYQGKATFINDALIENARHAVTNWKVNDWGSPGGIIQAENTTFRNNLRSVEFMAYENFSPSSQNVIRNLSSFKYCTFEHTQPLNTGENPIAMVTLWQVRGVQFNACYFNNYTDYEYQTGIYSIDAGYTVEDVCVGGTGPCSSNNMDLSQFNNLYIGVEATAGSGAAYKVSILDSEFEDCTSGVVVDGQNDVSVKGNQFTSEGETIWWSIFIREATGYEITGNSFINNGGTYNDGIVAYKTGADINVIDYNYTNDVSIGILSWSDNYEYSPLTEPDGLKFFCNEFNSSSTDIYINGGWGASRYQGDINNQLSYIAAGNTFSYDTLVYYYNNSDSGIIPTYFYSNQFRQIPSFVVNTNISESTANPCDGDESTNTDDFLDQLTPAQLSSSKNEYAIWKTIYTDRLLSYYNALDGGDYDDLISTIESTYSNDAISLRDDLLEKSPISYETFTAVIEQDVLSNAMLYEVLAINADLMQVDAVIETLETKNDPMPAYMISSLVDESSLMNYKDSMMVELGGLHWKRDREYRKILDHYQTYSDTGSSDSLLVWMGKHENEFTGKKRLLQYELSLQDNEAVSSELTQWLNVDYGVTSYNNHRDEYVDFLGEYMSAFYTSDGIQWPQDTPYFDALESYVSNTDYVSNNAKNIIRFNEMGIYEFPTPPSLLGSNKTSTQSKYDYYKEGSFVQTPAVNTSISAMLYPNPSGDTHVTLEVNGMQSENVYRYRLIDAQGREVKTGNLNQSTTLLEIDVEPGVYFFELYENNNRWEVINYTRF